MSAKDEFDEMSSYEADTQDIGTQLKEKIIEKISKGKHVLLYGPPGTGKTRLISSILNEDEVPVGNKQFVQFHPQYSYQDFVEGYSVKEGAFDYKPGVLLEFIQKIQDSDTNKLNVFVIDEINRAEISSVFGELMTLLDDPTNKSVRLPVSGEILETKSDFVIVGTMNSADKNIAILDFALRRRFDFLFVPPDYEGMRSWLNIHGLSSDEISIEQYVEFARKINERITIHPILGKNMTLGQALFVPQKNEDEQIALEEICEMVSDKVIPQIEAYLGNGNFSDMASLLSPDIMKKVQHGDVIEAHDILNLINSTVPVEEQE